jgi:hypothetical protein
LPQSNDKATAFVYSVAFLKQFLMYPSQLHALQNLLIIILGGIETNNLELSKQAIRRMQKVLDSFRPCPTPDGSEDES